MHRIMIPLTVTRNVLCCTLFTITGEVTSSVDAGAVIGGTVAGVIALMALIIPFLGCLIYNKKRKRRLHMLCVVM